MGTERSAAASPRVSVVIATYNRSEVLRYAIESVLWQTFADFELLVIGDGCTDDTAAVVASFGDPRIRWHNLESNSGSQWRPNNTGIAMARGTYIAYLGHDDLWLPDHLLRLVQAAERVDADVAYALLEMVGPPESDFRVITGLSRSGAYEQELYFPPSCMMHTRACALDVGGWRDARTIPIPTDNDFIFRLWAASKRFVPTHELTAIKFPAIWRRHSYRERQSGEQAAYARRIRTEPDFVTHELLATVSSYIWERGVSLTMPTRTFNLPHPWRVEHMQRLRGLGPADPAGEMPTMREYWLTGRDFRWLSGRSLFIADEHPPTAPSSSALEAGSVAPAGTFAGYHDGSAPESIAGWAWDSARPDTPLTVALYDGDRRLGTVLANLFRQDLVDAGIGNGRHGFAFEAPPSLWDGQPHTITLRIAGTDIPLHGSPQTLVCAPMAPQ